MSRKDPKTYGALAFLALLAASIGALSAVGWTDGSPASQWRAAVESKPAFTGIGGLLLAVAGMCLAIFVEAVAGLPRWGRLAGLAWAASFVLGGAFVTATVEMAGYQEHAEGTKTALLLGFLWLTPVAVFLGGAFALAAGVAAHRAGAPRWFAIGSLAAGGLAMLVTPLGAVGGIGNAGLAPLALWTLAAAITIPWLATRMPA